MQNDRQKKPRPKSQSVPEAKDLSKDSALMSGLERLAFKLHDLANRLLSFLPK